MKARSRARSWALQILYAWEMRGAERPLTDVLAEFMAERSISEASRAYLFRLVHEVSAHIREIDRALVDCLTNWRLERLSVIDRSILRIGAAELLFMADIPPRVSLQEAIVLAEKYGSGESPRFVNGVLDALMHRVGGSVPEGGRL